MDASNQDISRSISSLGNLPVSAIQGLYHAATGKTENLKKLFNGDYIIRYEDVEQLYYKITQFLEHYNVCAGPTITVQVKFEGGESQQFSSWERFKGFDLGKAEIVSDLTLKVEALVLLPGQADKPQRYIINVNLDSKLPVFAKSDQPGEFLMPMFLIRQIPSVSVSVEYIDYLFAKNICSVVEDWVGKLESIKQTKFILKLEEFSSSWGYIFARVGFLGGAIFALTYTWIARDRTISITELINLASIGVILATITSLLSGAIGQGFEKALRKGLIPPCLILTAGDKRAMTDIKTEAQNSLQSVMLHLSSVLLALAVNLAASFLYSWLTK